MIERWVRQEHELDPEGLWRLRTFSGLLLSLFLTAPTFALVNALSGHVVLAVVDLASLGTAPLVLWALRRAGTRVAAHVVAFLGTAVMVGGAVKFGGPQAPSLLWLGLLQPLVLIGAGPRAALGWGVVCTIAIWTVFLADRAGWLVADPSWRPTQADHALTATLFLALLGLTAQWWDRSRRVAIREAREAASRLHDAERRALLGDRLATLGTLAASVAHEMNTPLTYLMMNLDAMGARWAPGDPGGLAETRQAARQIADIVAQLRTFTREDAALRSFPVREAADAAIRLVGNQLQMRARIAVDLPEDLVVRASASQVAQVFVNLIANAGDAFTSFDEANLVLVRGRRERDEVVIEVEDNGVGIPPAHMAKIFEPFFTTKAEGRGTGLGLAITRDIVTRFGGEITVRSTHGFGSTFTVRWPASVLSSVPPTATLEPAPTRRLRVAVIDDDAVLGRAMARALAGSHEVVVFTSAEDALAAIPGLEVDAIVCDVMMPGVPAWEFEARLQALCPALSARTLFVSGGGFTDEGRAFIERTERFLPKPYSARQLADAVAKLVS